MEKDRIEKKGPTEAFQPNICVCFTFNDLSDIEESSKYLNIYSFISSFYSHIE